MRNWENNLSPIARERLAKIGELTQEEKEKVRDSEEVNSLLLEFHQGHIDPESLWKRLKEQGKPSLLREAQVRLIDSLTMGSATGELQRKKDGILAIETLKEEQNTSIIELNLKLMEDLRERHRAQIEQAYEGIRAEVEKNPRLRLKQVQQGQETMVIQLTVDEAIEQLPQWREFLSNQEQRYSQEFAALKEKLRSELK
ncbi:MAG: hypothetical protein ACXQTH_00615 [Dehalococcoidia bacterium]